jgi:hypothetical protein
MRAVAHELRDVSTGLWVWRLAHPEWRPGLDWEETVTSTCVEASGEVAAIDPLAPPDDAQEIWARLDARPPTLVFVLKPDHIRDVDVFVRRYGARAFGPELFWRTDIPSSSRSTRAASSPAASSPSTTGEAGTRRRCGFRNSARWSSRMR